MPLDRFSLHDNQFLYMGREKFAELWKLVEQLKESGYSKLSVYGTVGYGKSYMLAALVCLLMSHGDSVVYLPDCRALLLDPVEYVKTAMVLTFAAREDIQREITEIESEEGIKQFFNRHRRPRVIFVVDQAHELMPNCSGVTAGDRFSEGEKYTAGRWLDRYTFRHLRIDGLSANYRTYMQMQKETNQLKLYLYGGFSPVCRSDIWLALY